MNGLTLDAPHNLVFSIARRGNVAVALGETPGPAHGNPRPTIWRSTDGRTWDEVPTLREDFGGPLLTDLRAVAAGATGFAVVGNWKASDGTPVIAVWLSTDGLHWTREDHVPELSSHNGEELTATGIAAGPTGLVIVGETFAPTPTEPALVDGFIATSPDGKVWRRLTAGSAGLDNGGQVAIRQVTAEGNSFLAIGTRAVGPHNEVAAWQPGPGATWGFTTIAAVGFVKGMAVTTDGNKAWAAVIDDGAVRIWATSGRGHWRPIGAPTVGGADDVHLGATGGRLVLAVEVAGRAALWWG